MSEQKTLKIDGVPVRKWYAQQGKQKPTHVKGQIATRTEFYRRELNKVVKSLFEVKIPDEWDLDYFLNMLIYDGYVIITDSPVGTIAVKGGLSGINYMNLPTKAIMAVPILGNWVSWFGKQAEYIYLERDCYHRYYDFGSLIRITAEQLSSCDCCIDVNLMNSRISYAIEAETKAQAETIKQLYDDVTEGNPLVVYRKDSIGSQGSNGMQVFFGNVKNNYIANDILDTKRSIINQFLTSIGINNANTDKKERLVTDEVNANNMELDAQTRIWRENLKRGVDRVHKTFPDLDFDCTLRYDSSTVELAYGMIGGDGSDVSGRDRSVRDTGGK